LNQNKKKTILYVVNTDWFFLSHRLAIAKKTIEEGYDVHLLTEITTKKKEIEKYGILVQDIKFRRGSTSISQNLFLFIKILKIFKSINPDLIHLVTIKPVIIGGIAAHFLRKKTKLIISISGLGFIFIEKGFKAFFRKMIIILFYKLVFINKNIKVILQNKTDLKNICDFTNLTKKDAILIEGSGVNLNEYKFSKVPNSKPIVLFPARLISSKGIFEFIEAAKRLRNLGRFVIVGKYDFEARKCINLNELKAIENQGIIEYWGESNNMPKIFKLSSIVVLPSYREGMPKSLLEAAACGRAVVTTNVPGCRDAIIDGITGILVPPQDSLALSNGIYKLLKNHKLLDTMGTEGRKLAENKFDISKVVKKHLEIYEYLLSNQ
tara:strand:+ start:1161 stop:2297 length:1137 start_codon:yes stop_codon:yes gene_type:complete